ncbi:MAG: hypothetical protein EA366_07325 [Spirulina sp. DLM2.Bin59]|nr:MAG: hypothetical protein EA366_07325 [Spirulina sp. DLM2.Bin59]
MGIVAIAPKDKPKSHNPVYYTGGGVYAGFLLRIGSTMERLVNLSIVIIAGAAEMTVAEALAQVINLDHRNVGITPVAPRVPEPGVIYCPLTLDLPDTFPAIYRHCRDRPAQRAWVATTLNYPTGEGDLWLPVIWTAKGPLYGEAIAPEQTPAQPFHLKDQRRQPLYALAYQLLRHYEAIPSVYMLKFALGEQDIIFDHLIPFPNPAALGSVGIQTPDLPTCHWLCLSEQPIRDVVISNSLAEINR